MNTSTSFNRIAAFIVFLLAFTTLLTGSVWLWQKAAGSTSLSSKIPVVAAENVWGNIAEQLGGNLVHVTSIIHDPSADPHLYESDPNDSAAVASAKVVIVNGLGYDDFAQKLLAANPNTNRTTLVIGDVLEISGANANPHLWYNLPRIPEVARAITTSYETQDPAHTAYYEAQLATFTSSLAPSMSLISQIATQFPQAHVAYTERVSGYLLSAVNASVKTPESFAQAIEDGNDPTPADTLTMQTLLSSHAIRALIYNTQASTPVTQQLQDVANKNGISVVSVTEMLPTNEPTYQSWQQHQLQALQQALNHD